MLSADYLLLVEMFVVGFHDVGYVLCLLYLHDEEHANRRLYTAASTDSPRLLSQVLLLL